eukprot:906753_1
MHAKHHRNTNRMEGDEVFLPRTKSESESDYQLWFTGPGRLFKIVVLLSFGWIIHLWVHETGQHYPRWTSHFNPYAPCFDKKMRFRVIVSDLALAAVFYVLYQLCLTCGFVYMAKVYLVPYLIVNMWLVVVTFLHHTDVNVPKFRGKAWNWMRGALGTVDRDWGWFLNTLFHHIHHTHVIHHFFPKMPFYHTVEATNAAAELLGKYRLTDDTPIVEALWRANANCLFVADKGGVVFYERLLESKPKSG